MAKLTFWKVLKVKIEMWTRMLIFFYFCTFFLSIKATKRKDRLFLSPIPRRMLFLPFAMSVFFVFDVTTGTKTGSVFQDRD